MSSIKENQTIILTLLANQQTALESLAKSIDIIDSLINQPAIQDLSNPIGYQRSEFENELEYMKKQKTK